MPSSPELMSPLFVIVVAPVMFETFLANRMPLLAAKIGAALVMVAGPEPRPPEPPSTTQRPFCFIGSVAEPMVTPRLSSIVVAAELLTLCTSVRKYTPLFRSVSSFVLVPWTMFTTWGVPSVSPPMMIWAQSFEPVPPRP